VPTISPKTVERVGARRRDVCGAKTRRDVADDAQRLVGEDLSRGVGAADDLVEQRGRRAAVGVLLTVLGR
jgi:hypothetical protein